jgi:hypothetical protein
LKKEFTAAQNVRTLRKAETKALPVRELRERYNITEQIFFHRPNRTSEMEVFDAQRLQHIEGVQET